MRRVLVFAVCLALGCVAGLYWWRQSLRTNAPAHRAGPAVTRNGAPPAARPSRIAALAAEVSRDAISPIAAALNAPGGSIQQDEQILNAVFEAWRTNFPSNGNPVGENDEITLALAGENALHFAFIAPTHPAINVAGQLCDRWATPFRFHALSGTQMEIWSAGPDRRFGTADDVRFAPGQPRS